MDEQRNQRKFQKCIENYFYADKYNDSLLIKMLSFFEDENQVQFDGPRQNYGWTGSINFNNDVEAYYRSQMNANTG